jgi:hypothetical protein
MFKLVAMLFHLFHHLGLASQILESRDVNHMARDYKRPYVCNGAFGTLAVAFLLLLARVPQPNWLLSDRLWRLENQRELPGFSFPSEHSLG